MSSGFKIILPCLCFEKLLTSSLMSVLTAFFVDGHNKKAIQPGLVFLIYLVVFSYFYRPKLRYKTSHLLRKRKTGIHAVYKYLRKLRSQAILFNMK
jgi:hypothetical protein